jgi:hypothetical protein
MPAAAWQSQCHTTRSSLLVQQCWTMTARCTTVAMRGVQTTYVNFTDEQGANTHCTPVGAAVAVCLPYSCRRVRTTTSQNTHQGIFTCLNTDISGEYPAHCLSMHVSSTLTTTAAAESAGSPWCLACRPSACAAHLGEPVTIHLAVHPASQRGCACSHGRAPLGASACAWARRAQDRPTTGHAHHPCNQTFVVTTVT